MLAEDVDRESCWSPVVAAAAAGSFIEADVDVEAEFAVEIVASGVKVALPG